MTTQSAQSELALLFKRLIEAVRARAPRRALEVMLMLLAGVVMAGAGVIVRVVRLTIGTFVMLILIGLVVRVGGRLIRSLPFVRS